MVIHIGDLVRLSGKTRHGKNRIREHGDSWRWIDLPEDEHMNWEMVEKNDKCHFDNFQ